MTAPQHAAVAAPRGCRLRPTGPLVADDLRRLVRRMDELGIPGHADVEITTPLAPRDRRAATITVYDFPGAACDVVDEPPFDPARYGADRATELAEPAHIEDSPAESGAR